MSDNKTSSGAARANKARHERFDQLVASFRVDLFRYAFWLNRDRALAEDVVQEAMLRAWRALDKLREDQAVKPWLLTIVRRENARYFERKRLETVDIDALVGAETRFLASSDDPDIDDLRLQIFELADEYREPLALQVLMGFTTQEIATVMNIKPGAVLTRLHRARKQLKERVQRDLGE